MTNASLCYKNPKFGYLSAQFYLDISLHKIIELSLSATILCKHSNTLINTFTNTEKS